MRIFYTPHSSYSTEPSNTLLYRVFHGGTQKRLGSKILGHRLALFASYRPFWQKTSIL